MITDYLCAVFSLDAYQKVEDNIQIPSGWNTIATSDGFNLSLDGYFGIAYKNIFTKELVIAHRGTDNLFGSDFNDDVLQIGLGFIPGQYQHAQAFTNQVRADLGISLHEYTILHTGHSLGAVLAELTSIHDNIAAITFESPGTSLSMVETIVGATISNPNSLPIKIYNAAPNLVNTANPHVGQIYRVYPVFQSLGSPDLAGYYDFTNPTKNGQHSMNGILAQFDPVTAQPKVKSQPISWPSGLQEGYQSFKSYDSNPHYWELYFSANSMVGQAKFDFIDTYLGGVNNNAGTGEIIISDASDNDIWGTTSGADVVDSGDGNDAIIGYAGNDHLIGGSGTDTYIFAEDFGRDTIVDDDGILKYNGQVISGTAQEASNKPGTYILRMNGNPNIFILTRNGNDLNLAVNDVSDSPINAIIMSNYFFNNNNGTLARFGIRLQSDAMDSSPEVPAGLGVGAPILPKNVLSNGQYVAVEWQQGSAASVSVVAPDGTYINQVWSRATYRPDVAVLSNDNIVVTWGNTRPGNPYAIYDIMAEIVTPLGAVIAEPFIASDEVFGYSPDQISSWPIACPLRAGGFQLVWNGYDQDFGGISGNVFSSSGVKSHSSFQVNTFTTAAQWDVKAITLKNGNVVAAWNSVLQEEGGHTGVFAQMLSPSGQKIGPEFQVNVRDGISKYLQSLDALEDGNFRATIDRLEYGYFNRTFVLNTNLLSSSGQDHISGGTRDDSLVTFGSSVVAGGAGADIFTIGNAPNSVTTLTDFESSNPGEKIDLSSFPEISSFADLQITEGSAIVHLNNNQSIHITNLTPIDLSENNFIFAQTISSTSSTLTSTIVTNTVSTTKATSSVSSTGTSTKATTSSTMAGTTSMPSSSSTTTVGSTATATSSVSSTSTSTRVAPSSTMVGTTDASSSGTTTTLGSTTTSSYTSMTTSTIQGPVNHRPQVVCDLPNLDAQVGDTISIDPTQCVVDPDGDSLAWQVLGNNGSPSTWISVNATTGLINGIVPESRVYRNVVIATDPSGLSVRLPFSISSLSPEVSRASKLTNVMEIVPNMIRVLISSTTHASAFNMLLDYLQIVNNSILSFLELSKAKIHKMSSAVIRDVPVLSVTHQNASKQFDVQQRGALIPFTPIEKSKTLDLVCLLGQEKTTHIPIFTFSALDGTKEVGSMTLYGRPTLCRSENGLRHNVLERTGVFQTKEPFDAKELIDICASLPLDETALRQQALVRASTQGILRGSTNVIGQAMRQHGYSDSVSQFTTTLTYYIGYWLLSFMQYYQAHAMDDDHSSTMIQSAMKACFDLLWLLIINSMCEAGSKVVNFSAQKAQDAGWKKTGYVTKLFGENLNVLVYANNARQQGVVDTALTIASGAAVQKLTESVGARLLLKH